MEEALFIYLTQEQDGFSSFRKEALASQIRCIPKLGLMYLASALEDHHIHATIKDQTRDFFTPADLITSVASQKLLFIGFYSSTIIKKQVVNYIKEIKKQYPSIPILVGGPGFFAANEYLAAGCDIVCYGEGEETIIEIVKYLRHQMPLHMIKGIAYQNFSPSGTIIETPERPILPHIDNISFPKRVNDKSLLDYRDFNIFNMRLPYTTMITSRGCPFKCTFCSAPGMWGNKIRQRSPENVISEIDFCVNQLGTRYIGFKDDIFGINSEWIVKFCNLLIKEKYKLKWSCISHPLCFRKERSQIIPLLKKAGLDMITFGLQSTEANILKNIRRHPSEPRELAETIEVIKRNTISVNIQFILGLPGENNHTLKSNLKYSLKVKPHYIQVSSFTLLEGSELNHTSQNETTTDYSNKQLQKSCNKSLFMFYTHPTIILQNFVHVLRKNPFWFFRISKFFGQIIKQKYYKQRFFQNIIFLLILSISIYQCQWP